MPKKVVATTPRTHQTGSRTNRARATAAGTTAAATRGLILAGTANRATGTHRATVTSAWTGVIRDPALHCGVSGWTNRPSGGAARLTARRYPRLASSSAPPTACRRPSSRERPQRPPLHRTDPPVPGSRAAGPDGRLVGRYRPSPRQRPVVGDRDGGDTGDRDGLQPNSADRLLFWINVKDLQAMTDADLDRWRTRGVDGFVAQSQWLAGMGSNYWFTPVPGADLSDPRYALQRSLRDSKVLDRAKARGMKLYLAFNLVGLDNPVTPLVDWFDDAGWDQKVLPRVSELAGGGPAARLRRARLRPGALSPGRRRDHGQLGARVPGEHPLPRRDPAQGDRPRPAAHDEHPRPVPRGRAVGLRLHVPRGLGRSWSSRRSTA